LVHKLRELNKRVIGIGVEAATSSLLPPACDEFLFYDRLQGVETTAPRARRRGGRRTAPEEAKAATARSTDLDALGVLVTQTLSGLKRRSGDVVPGSTLKRTLLRKDPTFDEAEYGFRSLGELLRNLAERGVIRLLPGKAPGDPEVDFPDSVSGDEDAFELLRSVVGELGSRHLSGLKNEVRKRRRDFTEKRYGYGGFLQFCKAAQARGYVEMEWDDEAEDYLLRAVEPTPTKGKTSEQVPARPRRRRAASTGSVKRSPRSQKPG
jgi:hypothetical protein